MSGTQLRRSVRTDVNRRIKNGMVALHFAAMKNDLAEVKKLINRGAEINIEDDYGITPLLAVALENKGNSHFQAAETLLKNGATVAEGFLSPLDTLIPEADLEFLQLFLDYKAEQNSTFIEHKMTLLFPATVFCKNPEIVEYLVKNLGMDVNHRTIKRQTPMHWAGEKIGYSKVKNMKFLMKNGADVNALDHDGRTPLSYALEDFNSDITDEKTKVKHFKFLMEHSDLNVINSYGDNILSYPSNSIKFCKIMLMHLAKLQTLDNTLVHSSLLNSIDSNGDYKNYYERCKEELSRAKSTKLKNSWVSYYQLLVDGKRRLKNYAGNKNLIKDFQKSDRIEQFPIYGSWMDENVRKGIKRRQVFDKSSGLLSECLPVFDPYHLTIRDILDCLSNKDLVKLRTPVQEPP